MPPARINTLGSEKGDGFLDETKPLERRYQADGLGRRAQEWRVGEETFLRSSGRRKALEGET